MKEMGAFEKWQVGVLVVQAAITLAAFLAAYYFGLKQVEISQKQNEINDRLLRLQDYVAVSATPGDGVIDLWNTGKSNIYLWGFDMPSNNMRFEKPRLISADKGSRYWIPLPNLGKISTTTNFEFKLYLTDEYENKWVSEVGGEADPVVIKNDSKKSDGIFVKIWSYKTQKVNWQF